MNKEIKMKTLYLAVDMQKDFMDHDGALYVTGSEEIKSNIKKLATKMDKIATHKFYTMDWHEEDDSELSDNPDFKTTFPPHCIAGTKGAWLIPQAIGEDTYPDENDFLDDRTLVFYKNEFSVFKGNEDFLNSLNAFAYFDKIYIAGVVWEFCVTAVIEGLLKYKSKQFDFEQLYIVSDCIVAMNEDKYQIDLRNLQAEYPFVHIVTQDEIKLVTK
jgi:nicotinamidase/pyrazinamidase